MKIKNLPEDQSLEGVKFRYPKDGQAYYWASQWAKGVWGRKHPDDGRLYPLFVDNIQEALEWGVL